MKVLQEDQLVDRVLGWVRDNNRNPDMSNGQIDLNTDLLSVGALDSLAFIDLISFIEENTARKIDLADIDPEEFTTVKGLCRHAINNCNGA